MKLSEYICEAGILRGGSRIRSSNTIETKIYSILDTKPFDCLEFEKILTDSGLSEHAPRFGSYSSSDILKSRYRDCYYVYHYSDDSKTYKIPDFEKNLVYYITVRRGIKDPNIWKIYEFGEFTSNSMEVHNMGANKFASDLAETLSKRNG